MVLAASLALALAVPSGADAPPLEKVARDARVTSVEHVKDGEELLVQATGGSIEVRGDPKATDVHVEAEFEVDGEDPKDVTRRAQLVRLYAERAPDGAIVVEAVFPGKPLPRDRANVVVVVPRLARATVRSTTGSIAVRDAGGSLRLATQSGAVEVRSHAGPVEVQSGSGSVVVADAREEVRVTARSGAVDVRLADGNDRPVEIESKSGTVLLEAGSGFDGVIEARTTSGTIAIEDPARRASVPTQGPHRVQVEIGAATVRSEIRTTSGAVTIRVRG